MQTTTVTTIAIVSPAVSTAASSKRSCVSAIWFLWRSSLSSCKRILKFVEEEGMKERKSEKEEETYHSVQLLVFLDFLTGLYGKIMN